MFKISMSINSFKYDNKNNIYDKLAGINSFSIHTTLSSYHNDMIGHRVSIELLKPIVVSCIHTYQNETFFNPPFS